MKTALVLGGASCLWSDVSAFLGGEGAEIAKRTVCGPGGLCQGVVACNDAGAEWPGDLDGWVSLHPQFFTRKGWLEKRQGPPPKRIFAHHAADKAVHRGRYPVGIEFTDYKFPGQERSGSSGLFAAKVALIDLGFDRAVLCGISMDPRPHFFDHEGWRSAEGFRSAWLAVPQEYRDRMRSMSGWTRTLLGAPEIETKEKPDEQ